MTSTVNRVSEAFTSSSGYESLALGVDVIAVALLIFLLVEQELVRSYIGPSARSRIRPLGIALAPLLLAFGAIVVLRSLGVR